MNAPLTYATEPEIDATMVRLRATFASGRTRAPAWRRAQLQGILAMLKAEESAINAALAADLGKGPVEVMISELGPVKREAEEALRHLRGWMRQRRVATPVMVWPGKSWLMPEPLGVVLDIAAWNFPFMETLAPMIGALAAGNCVLAKPSELSPASARLLAEMLPRYLDPDAVAVLQGDAQATQAILARRFDHIIYTGGGAVGRVVMAAAAQHLTPVTLELGGKSPVIVDRTADIALAARRIVWAKSTCAGQVCINADYLLVHEDVAEALVAALKAEFARQLGADPSQSPDYARIVNHRHFDRLVGYLGEGRIVHGGRHDRDARYIEPTLLADVPEGAAVLREEIFGPILPVLTWGDEGAMLARLAQADKPLALYVFTRDRGFEGRVLDRISAGNVAINDLMLFMAVPGLPFGGVGASGMGSYKGRAGFERFSHLKPVLRRGSWLDVAARYAPFTAAKTALLRRLMG